MRRKWFVILVVGLISAVSVSCDSATKSTPQYKYECACNCQSPIGNILNRFNVCASNYDDAMSKTGEMMDKRGCDFSISCYPCEQQGSCD